MRAKDRAPINGTGLWPIRITSQLRGAFLRNSLLWFYRKRSPEVCVGDMSRHPSFDDLIGKLLEVRWHIDTDCLGSFEVDHEIEPLRLLYRQLAWLGTVQNLANIFPASSPHLA